MKSIMKKTLKISIFLLALFVLGLFYSYFIEPFTLEVRREEIIFQNLPQNLLGLKIMHLSDFHCRDFTRREEKLIDIISKENPDFIFFTGDFIENEKWISVCQKIISKIFQENKNFFGVFGNHDRLTGFPISKLKESLEEKGVKILVNEAKEIPIKNSSFYLVGVDDPWLGYDDLKEALKDVPKEDFKILLSHSPGIFLKEKAKITENKINLILSGHTHGGQINIPFLTNVLISLWLGGKYTAGLFEEDGIFIYVSRGVGTFYLLPLRFNCPPEVTLISFKGK